MDTVSQCGRVHTLCDCPTERWGTLQPRRGAAVLLSAKLCFCWSRGESVPGLEEGSGCCAKDLLDWISKAAPWVRKREKKTVLKECDAFLVKKESHGAKKARADSQLAKPWGSGQWMQSWQFKGIKKHWQEVRFVFQQQVATALVRQANTKIKRTSHERVKPRLWSLDYDRD